MSHRGLYKPLVSHSPRAIGQIDKSWRNHMILYQPKAEYIYINNVLCSQDRGRTELFGFGSGICIEFVQMSAQLCTHHVGESNSRLANECTKQSACLAAFLLQGNKDATEEDRLGMEHKASNGTPWRPPPVLAVMCFAATVKNRQTLANNGHF